MLNTLVSIVNEYMGSQWALFMPTHVYVRSQLIHALGDNRHL